jgi:VanZ family protein
LIQQQRFGRFLAVVSLFVIALATLYPLSAASQHPLRWCIVCGQFGGRDVILNILLFVPFGAGLRLSGMRTLPALVTVAVLTITVELLQYAVIPGRDASGSDVAMNTLGGVLGMWLASRWRFAIVPGPASARRLALGGSAVLTLLLAGSAWGARFADTNGSVYWGQWAHRFSRRAHFLGRVLEARVAGLPLRDGALTRTTADVRARLERGDVRFDAIVVPADPTSGNAPIVTMTDGRSVELLILEQHDRDMVFAVHVRANRLRLGGPRLRLRGVFPSTAAETDTMRIGGRLDRGRLTAYAGSRQATVERGLRLGPWTGWSFVAPFQFAFGALFPWLTAAWAFVLVFPIGYWGARGVHDRRAVGLATASVISLPLLLGIAFVELIDDTPSDPAALFAAAAGLASGWLVGRRPFMEKESD